MRRIVTEVGFAQASDPAWLRSAFGAFMSGRLKVVIASAILAPVSEAMLCAVAGNFGHLMDKLTILGIVGFLFHIPGMWVEALLGHAAPADHGVTPVLMACGGVQFFIIYWSAITGLGRFTSRHTAEPGASPNGGPAMPHGNSGGSGGPPSVS